MSTTTRPLSCSPVRRHTRFSKVHTKSLWYKRVIQYPVCSAACPSSYLYVVLMKSRGLGFSCMKEMGFATSQYTKCKEQCIRWENCLQPEERLLGQIAYSEKRDMNTMKRDWLASLMYLGHSNRHWLIRGSRLQLIKLSPLGGPRPVFRIIDVWNRNVILLLNTTVS